MKSIEIIELKVSALVGSSIGECMKEAIELSAKEWRNVTLIHNDKHYRVKVNDLLASVVEI